MREKGAVQYYNADRGFGFVTRVGNPNVFFHVRNFAERPAEGAIERGMRLSYTVGLARDGRPMADRIEILPDDIQSGL